MCEDQNWRMWMLNSRLTKNSISMLWNVEFSVFNLLSVKYIRIFFSKHVWRVSDWGLRRILHGKLKNWGLFNGPECRETCCTCSLFGCCQLASILLQLRKYDQMSSRVQRTKTLKPCHGCIAWATELDGWMERVAWQRRHQWAPVPAGLWSGTAKLMPWWSIQLLTIFPVKSHCIVRYISYIKWIMGISGVLFICYDIIVEICTLAMSQGLGLLLLLLVVLLVVVLILVHFDFLSFMILLHR